MTEYGPLDRFMHRLALRRPGLQRMMAEIEARILPLPADFPSRVSPVLVTGLPRAGTTLLLEVIAQAAPFAAHTYRDMPFILAPALWGRVSGGFRRTAVSRERAHGDGMTVDHDSVEAFEEVVWLAFWRDHYEASRIRPWRPDETDADGEFLPFYREHMRRIVHLRRTGQGGAATRYVSKNNANIARLEWLGRHVPEARIVVPFRDPAGHVRSLMTQHARFTELHGKDAFARDYMQMIGHFEFGRAIRPLDFGGWLDGRDPSTAAASPGFWAEYWIAAHRHILDTAPPGTVFLSYDALCDRPAQGLARLAGALDLSPDAFAASMSRFRPPTQGADPIPARYHAEIGDIHAALLARSLV